MTCYHLITVLAVAQLTAAGQPAQPCPALTQHILVTTHLSHHRSAHGDGDGGGDGGGDGELSECEPDCKFSVLVCQLGVVWTELGQARRELSQ